MLLFGSQSPRKRRRTLTPRETVGRDDVHFGYLCLCPYSAAFAFVLTPRHSQGQFHDVFPGFYFHDPSTSLWQLKASLIGVTGHGYGNTVSPHAGRAVDVRCTEPAMPVQGTECRGCASSSRSSSVRGATFSAPHSKLLTQKDRLLILKTRDPQSQRQSQHAN